MKLLPAVLDRYALVLALVGIYFVFQTVSFGVKAPPVWYRALLAAGPPWIVHLWGIQTVVGVMLFVELTGDVKPKILVRLGVEASVCLSAVSGQESAFFPRELASATNRVFAGFAGVDLSEETADAQEPQQPQAPHGGAVDRDHPSIPVFQSGLG